MSFTDEQKKNARAFMAEWQKNPIRPQAEQAETLSYAKVTYMTDKQKKALKDRAHSIYLAIKQSEKTAQGQRESLKEQYQLVTAELNKLIKNTNDPINRVESVKKQFIHELALLVMKGVC